MFLAVALIIFACLSRVAAVYDYGLSNFSPLMALTFCGAIYFKGRRMWLIPFAALMLTDLWINQHYVTMGYAWTWKDSLIRLTCFGAGLGLGWLVSQRKTWLNLFSGALGGAILFYLVTNTASWFGDTYYTKTLAGWWQAMTVGHPQFAPTLFFFRNTLISDLVFTGIFAGAMEVVARRAGKPSLLARAQVRA
ncbi:MAG TPA: DUF6580 family putative transport protein [Opitutaceae bacterium]|nr:DUF6580 family putative transport protein [Opitutaceae bacterium]